MTIVSENQTKVRPGTCSEAAVKPVERLGVCTAHLPLLGLHHYPSILNNNILRLFVVGLISATILFPALVSASDVDGSEFFELKIRPLLAEKCYSCHSAEAKKIKGALRVDSYEAMLAGGTSNKPALVPGNLESSALIHAVRWLDEDTAMPPKERLAPEEVALLERWIVMGAPHPDAGGAKVRDRAAELLAAKSHWSFQPLIMPTVPTAGEGWAQSDIDRFVAAGFAQVGIKPVADADKRTLIRRATFDLTGLPPTMEEVEQFLGDKSPKAFASVIDRLLASPAYGERWGRHWLDLARYADTEGDSSDYPVPQAYRYRNYVINSFNADKPYDQFLREQIAGDLLPAKDEAHHREMTIGTGFIALSRRFGTKPEGNNYLTIEDTIDTTGRVMMGLSLSCARCHDHKFDPIPTSDYYALYGIFSSTRYPFPGSEFNRFQHSFVQLVSNEERDQLLGDKKDRILAIDAEYELLTNKKEQHQDVVKIAKSMGSKTAEVARREKDLQKQINELMKERLTIIEQLPQEIPTAYAVSEGVPHHAHIHKRGEPGKPGDEVIRGFLQIAGGQKLPDGATGSGRLELAGWLTNAKNPLTARVAANRLWHLHFGRGIVPSTTDFGLRGRPPVNQPLLDWLAVQLIKYGWSFNQMHRRIMLSRTYQLATANNPHAMAIDAENAYCWKFNRRNLAAEEIRDSVMAVSGTLDRAMAGEHKDFPSLNKKNYTQHSPFQAVYNSSHRSIYVMQQRISKHPFFEIFDGADTNTAVGERVASISPMQALFQLNSPFMEEQAQALTNRLQAAGDSISRVAAAYVTVLSRPATEQELREGVEYLRGFEELAKVEGTTNLNPLSSFIRALCSSNEFMCVE